MAGKTNFRSAIKKIGLNFLKIFLGTLWRPKHASGICLALLDKTETFIWFGLSKRKNYVSLAWKTEQYYQAKLNPADFAQPAMTKFVVKPISEMN